MKKKITLLNFIIALAIVAGAGILFLNESNAQGKSYKIGDKGPAGGWVFYDKGRSSEGWRYLEAAPKDQGKAEWGCNSKPISGAKGTVIGTGKTNTAEIINSCGGSKLAAKVASSYRGGGKSDWFLPSKDELNQMYVNLKKVGIGGFTNNSYWSSSEFNDDNAWTQLFDYYGAKSNQNKIFSKQIRAVRAF